jgi:cytochrome c553
VKHTDRVILAAALVVAMLLSVDTMARGAIQDTIEQRAKPCVSCHGNNGRAGPDGYYPRLAGKPAGYLSLQLIAFRDGTRHNETMAHLLRGMPDRYLKEFADYFSSQRVPFEPPVPVADVALLSRGQQLVLSGDAKRGVPACTACHGQHLLGAEPNVPGLVGLPASYLNAQLGAWRIGRRQATPPDCMAAIAQRLEPSDITAVVGWIGSRTPEPSAAPEDHMPTSPPIDCGDFHEGGIGP